MARQERNVSRNYTLSEYHDLYLEEDRFDIWHEDEFDGDLDVIHIPLPSLTEFYSEHLGREVSREEALTYVKGYGLHPDKQKFSRDEMPNSLKELPAQLFKKLRGLHGAKFKEITDVENEHYYAELHSDQQKYKGEIEWIRTQIKRRYVGTWVFIKGKPTYLNGANFFFLNYWHVKNKGRNANFPDYRDYQRKMFNMLMYCYTTKDAYFLHRILYRDVKGTIHTTYSNKGLEETESDLRASGISDIYLDRNFNSVVEQEKRTCHGVNFVSSRRVAKTAIACCFSFWGTTNVPEQTFIIQAMNEDHAKQKVYNKQILTPFTRLPFFFRPFYRGREDSSGGLKFQYNENMAAMSRAGVVPEAMECFITPMPNTEKAADGEAEIAFIYRDEAAKKIDEGGKNFNLLAWWNNTMKPAIERGDEIWGFAIMPSTVGNMDTGGGSQFLELANSSHFSDRNDNGTTDSGLFNFFLAGYYAVEGFIDEYGASIIEDPKEPVLNNRGEWKKIGAKTWVKNRAASLERKGDWSALIQHLQNYPFTWRDAFAVAPKDMGIPVEKLREVIKRLKFLRTPKTLRCNLKWVGNNFGSDVYVEEDPKGDWTFSYLPPIHQRNQRTIVTPEEGYIKPINGSVIYAPALSVQGKFFMGGDSVKFHKRNTTAGAKKSSPAAVVFYDKDESVDMVDGNWKAREEWVSEDFIMFYKKKVEDKSEYHEEWLKCCIMLGAHFYPEFPDGEDICDYFQEHGFDGYLLRDMGNDGKVATRPGVYASPDTINSAISGIMTFYSQNYRYTKIWEIAQEWSEMRGADDLTHHDLCAASMWSLRATKSKLPKIFRELNQPLEIEGGFDEYEI